jgi:hypothetical protein
MPGSPATIYPQGSNLAQGRLRSSCEAGCLRLYIPRENEDWRMDLHAGNSEMKSFLKIAYTCFWFVYFLLTIVSLGVLFLYSRFRNLLKIEILYVFQN